MSEDVEVEVERDGGGDGDGDGDGGGCVTLDNPQAGVKMSVLTMLERRPTGVGVGRWEGGRQGSVIIVRNVKCWGM